MTVAAVILLAGISRFFAFYSDGAFVEWISTFLGTIIGASLAAGIGLWLFRYQEGVREERRVEDLRTALIAELYATRDRLRVEPNQEVPDPQGSGPVIRIVLGAHIEPTVCDEVLRSALFGHENTVAITYLARLMRDYTKRADAVQAMIERTLVGDPRMLQRIYEQAINVKRLQTFVLSYCDSILEGFEAQGITLPSEDKFFSDPSRAAPEESLRYDE